jgi:type VI secretion system secreted protein VgrG
MTTNTVSTKVTVSSNRRIRFEFDRLVARDAMSAPFRYELEVTGTAGMDIERMLGMDVSVRIDLQGPIGRYFHGQVEQAEALPSIGRKGGYRLLLGPDLSRLSRCSRSRVFHNVRLTDLVSEILSEHDLSFSTRYFRDHPPESVVIQYDESDLAFASRLIREAGVFYYFVHAEDGHELMLCDSADGISAIPGYETQNMVDPTARAEGLLRLDPKVQASVARFELDDVDPTDPAADLAVGYGILRRGAPCATHQDYPGGYTETGHGLERARIRLQEIQARSQTATGEAASRGVVVGRSFVLQGHARKDQNADQVPIETVTVVEAGRPTAAGPSLKTARMHCSLVTTLLDAPMPLPAAGPGRDLRGPHTARVVGPSGEHVAVDEYARVRVRFPWQDQDEPGIQARVGQSWAGSGRAALAIPHVGDEVLVEFEHGDARRPIVVGSLYNGAALPPVSLPDNKAQTVFRTRSSGRGAVSELRMDDREGQEVVSLQAGRDMETLVANDSRSQIGGSLNQAVSGSHSRSVGGDATESIAGSLNSSVGDDVLSTIGRDLTQSVGRNQTLSVDKGLTVTVGDNGTVSTAKKLTLSADTSILIRNGKASIELRTNGDVIIKGQKVTVEAAGQLRLKGSDVIEQEG